MAPQPPIPCPARTQWPHAAQPDSFDVCEIAVDMQEGICELHFHNVTAGLGYAEVLHLRNQLDVVVGLLEPPAPVGRTYTPKMGNH